MAYDAVVLAGGSGARLGGIDKAEVVVGGERLLDRVLAACAGARSVVVVGPQRRVRRPMRWAREEPPGSGPLAGLAAGLAALGAAGTREAPEVVVVLAVDLPHLVRGDIERLVDALELSVAEASAQRIEAACLVDAAGRHQPLAAAYRAGPLRAAVAAAAPHAGRPLVPVVRGLRTVEVPGGAAADDVDTPEDLSAARARSDDG